MKIPLDFILRIIEKFLNEHEMENVIKKLKKHFETPEEDFSDIISELSLQEIISKYVKENKELKKKIKSKVKKYMKEHKDDEEEDEKIDKEENEEKLTTKKRKRTLSNAKEEEPEARPEKKRKRTMSSTKEEKEEIKEPKKRKRTLSNAKEENEKEEKKSKKKIKLEESDNEENDKDKKDEEKEEKPKKSKNKDKKKKDEDDIDLEKEVKFIPKPKSDNNPDRVPFKRIDDSKLKHEVPEKYRDNSYAAYLKQTGDDFGKAANDKLIVTRGKGFRKEKTKFKNKTFHGGMTISTTVRSIPLEDDDSSED
jgi:hypothetical protein